MISNSVTLVGNLAADPELNQSESGVSWMRIRFAVNRRWQNSNNEWEEDVSFFAGTVWRDLAENIAASVKKGDRIIVVGRLQQRQWETPEGEKKSVVEVSIDDVGPSLRWAQADVTKTTKPSSYAGADDVPPPEEPPF